jgi:hypothetical protein
MRRLVFLLVCCLPLTAWAEDLLCASGPTVTRYLTSRDPSSVQDDSCTVIPKNQVMNQRAVLDNIRAQFGTLYHSRNPLLYVKASGGLMIPMTGDATSGEIGTVNATVDAATATQQAFVDEVSGQDFCNATTLGTVTTRLATVHDTLEATINAGHDTVQTTIDATTLTLASVKASMTTMNNGTAAGLRQVNDTYAIAVRKLARCLLALRHAK